MPSSYDENLSERELAVGYLITKYKPYLRIVGIVFLSIVSVSMLGMALYQIVNWSLHIKQTNQIWHDISPSLIQYGEKRTPEDIAVIDSVAIQHDSASVDVLIKLKNNNDQWAVSDMEYELLIDGTSTGIEHITFEPKQEQWVTKTALASTDPQNATVRIVVKQIDWKKASASNQVSLPQWGISNTKLYSIQSGVETAPKTGFDFTITNKNEIGFRNIDAIVVLTNDQKEVVAIARQPISTIHSLESQTYTVRWPSYLPRELQQQVFITANLLDENNIIR